LRISDGRCASRTSRKVYGVRPTARSPKFSRSDLEMQRFESCRLSQPVRLQRVTYEGRAKPRGTAWFRRYELVSVCGIWQWRGRPGPGARAFRRARMARLPPSRHAVHRGLWILISERETIPPSRARLTIAICPTPRLSAQSMRRCGLNATSQTRLQRCDGHWWSLSSQHYRGAHAALLQSLQQASKLVTQ
jgi:hypothetical protein